MYTGTDLDTVRNDKCGMYCDMMFEVSGLPAAQLD